MEAETKNKCWRCRQDLVTGYMCESCTVKVDETCKRWRKEQRTMQAEARKLRKAQGVLCTGGVHEQNDGIVEWCLRNKADTETIAYDQAETWEKAFLAMKKAAAKLGAKTNKFNETLLAWEFYA